MKNPAETDDRHWESRPPDQWALRYGSLHQGSSPCFSIFLRIFWTLVLFEVSVGGQDTLADTAKQSIDYSQVPKGEVYVPLQWIAPSEEMGESSRKMPPIDSRRPSLKLNLVKLLSPKQVSILKGGFTTVSQLIIQLPAGGETQLGELDSGEVSPKIGQLPPLKELRCSVKFDAWEETFEVIHMGETLPGDQPSELGTVSAKSLEDYGLNCLSADLDFAKVAPYFLQLGGKLIVTIIVKQTSLDETARIKDWLIQQQSGVIQGLFSHMLGDLTLHQVVRMILEVPPYSRPKIGDYKK
jgi:hypothetical protein